MILASQVSPAATTALPAASSSDSSLEDSGSKWPPRHTRKEKKKLKRGKFAPSKKLHMAFVSENFSGGKSGSGYSGGSGNRYWGAIAASSLFRRNPALFFFIWMM
jgi:hypothetical protein